MSGWISACLNHPCLFEIQFPLNLATSLVADGACVVELLHALTFRFDQLPLQIATSFHHVVGAVAHPMPFKASEAILVAAAQSPGQIGGKRAAMDERLQLVQRGPARQQGDKAQDAMVACLPAVNSTMPLV